MNSMVDLGIGYVNNMTDEVVCVYDRRRGDHAPKNFVLAEYEDYEDFLCAIRKEFGIANNEKHIICNTKRELINDDIAFADIENGETLYIISDINQALSAPAKEKIQFVPHYDTLVRSGMYEYYASEGRNPIPYAFSELIDNALTATAKNTGTRNIELRLMLDDNVDRCAIFVIDDGEGMTTRQLNNWAIYRLSRFNCNDSYSNSFYSSDQLGLNYCMPRFLNSAISYFGVGGKQAIFFLGSATRVITKSTESCDVHELAISKDDFEDKVTKKEFVYDGYIFNRKPGDSSHIKDDDYVQKVISEEPGKESFTCVVIQGIIQEHVQYLKSNFMSWCRQLTHIYHYYLHGPNGNVQYLAKQPDTPFGNISIEVNMFIKGHAPKSINLRDIDEDLQTLYIRSAAHTFDFKAAVEGCGYVEGILRYHPFLYDKETYPFDIEDVQGHSREVEEDQEYGLQEIKNAQRRPIFECYWNGRLIPYTCIDEFEWCAPPKKIKNIPEECYNRLSGVLWTNDMFIVSTNKLTFMDLEVKLREKNTMFCRVIGGQEKRGAIAKQFNDWLQECHEKFDKQIFFMGFNGLITRPDMPKAKQYPWSTFWSIEWDGKVYRKGQLVKLRKVNPIYCGSIRRFLLYGDNEGDTFATGGFVEIVLEPQSLYGDIKIHPLCKLDRSATDQTINKWIEEEEGKLPDRLIVSWPENDELPLNGKITAGSVIGAIKVEICNRKGELISKLPGSTQKKLLVEMKVLWHSPKGNHTSAHHICHHSKNWAYWFKKMENLKNLGPHTLHLQAVINESGSSSYSGKELPSHRIRFTVVEGEAKVFKVLNLDDACVIGEPFKIHMQFMDEFGNITRPTSTFTPLLESNELEIKYSNVTVKGNILIIKDVIAKGLVSTSAGKNFNVIVKIPELKNGPETVRIHMVPGKPHQLMVQPSEAVIKIENGSALKLEVQAEDIAGNHSWTSKLPISCKFQGRNAQLPIYNAETNVSGFAVLTGPPLKLIKLSGSEKIKAVIDVPSHSDIACIEKTVCIVPSSKACQIAVTYLTPDNANMVIKSGEQLRYPAGDVIRGLQFKLHDESGRLVSLTNKIIYGIKINWVPRFKNGILMKGQLPDVRVPCSVKEHKYCSIMFNGEIADFVFTIVPTPQEPANLQCILSKGGNVRLDETLASDIVMTITDTFNNPIKLPKSDLKYLSASADGMYEDNLIFTAKQDNTFVIKGVKFTNCSLGPKDFHVKWKHLETVFKLVVLAGPPKSIRLPGYESWINENKVLAVTNGKLIPAPFIVELCDGYGNPSREENVRVQLVHEPSLEVALASHFYLTNPAGRVNFGEFVVSVKESPVEECQEGICGNCCHGEFTLYAKAIFSGQVICSPTLRLHLPLDPSKPVQLTVNYDTKAKFVAGELLPDFKVSVIAEDGSLLANANSATSQIIMNIWQGEEFNSENQNSLLTYSPVSFAKDSTGTFLFRNLRVPEVAGLHSIKFTYSFDKSEIFSSVISVNVVPNVPTKLVPLQQWQTPIVLNSHRQTSRTVIKDFGLELRDNFDNFVNDASGKLIIRLIAKDNAELPVLAGNVTSLSLIITKGRITLQNIRIEENSPGADGKEYFLKCKAVINNAPKHHKIPSFIIPFLFYDDYSKQAEMAILTKERDALINDLKAYKSFFKTSMELNAAVQSALQSASKEVEKFRKELQTYNVHPSSLSSVSNVAKLINVKTEEQNAILRQPRRQCSLKPAAEETDVVGKVGHLALIADDDIARVLSWHMASDMDCVITHTMAKAMQIYSKSRGAQQVISLDAIFKKNIPDWNKPLPHIKIKSNFKPSGNPVYARKLLIFPKDSEDCKLVFGSLLGDAIILDTIEDAANYRKEIVQHTYCPTLLTRQGDRMRSNGKFGGLQNKAPSIEKLHDAIFGEPLPAEYSKLGALIETLQLYRRALESHAAANVDLMEYQRNMQSEKMIANKLECSKKEKQLEEIEKQLGTSASLYLAASQATAEISTRCDTENDSSVSSFPPVKRARMKSYSSSSVGASSQSTPGRSTSVVTRRLKSNRP